MIQVTALYVACMLHNGKTPGRSEWRRRRSVRFCLQRNICEEVFAAHRLREPTFVEANMYYMLRRVEEKIM